MRLKYFIIILFLISAVSAQKFNQGQAPKIGVLQGTVIDSITSQPIEYASISLVNLRTNDIVTGSVSDEDGKFDISQIPAGRYNISIEYIGYNRLVKGPVMFNPRENSTHHNLGNVKLKQSALAFQDVEVQGERPLFVQTMDKKIFNVEQNTISSGGSALDALRQVPGVDVDIDGNVSLRGSANVNILIDGKPAIMAGGDSKTILENIPSDNIRDVEVVTNPSAKYDPEGMAGIINVVLKENRFAGINGNLKSGISTLGSYNGSGQINYRNEKFNVFTNVGLRHNIRGGSGDNYRETELTGYTSILDQTVDSERGGDNIFIKSGVEYFPNLKNSIGVNTTYSDGNRISDRLTITDQTDESYVQYERNSEGDNDSRKVDFALSYDRKFDNPKQKLSANARMSNNNHINKDYQITTAYPGFEEFVDEDPEKTTTDNEYLTTDIQTDYIHPFGENTKLEVGYKGTIRSIDNLFDTFIYKENIDNYNIDDERSSHFLYDENIQAGYGVFSTQKGIVGLQLGLRGEVVETTSELLDTNEKIENPYTSYYPSFAISVGPPQLFQVQLSYSRRVNRPSYRRLNPSIRSFDQYNIRSGNPFLEPEYIDVAEINFSKFRKGLSISAGTYYRRITDKISHYKFVRDDGVSVTTYENYDTQETYGLELIVSGSLGKKFRVMMNGNVFADEVNASNVFDEDYDKTSTGFMSRITGTYNISPTMEIMVMGFYRSPRDMPIGRMESMAFTSLSAKKKLLDDRLSVSLNINDVLNTMGFEYTTIGENYFQESSRKWMSQAVSLQLEYKFGSIEDKSSFSRNRNGSNGDDENDMGDYEIE